jgi:hypothetical protein
MRWRDIRFEKPTEADANDDNYIFQKLTSGRYTAWHWDSLADCIAWMPLSELPAFDRIPDPPEGWRFVDKEKDARHDQAKFWNEETKHWGLVNPHLNHWLSTHAYIVPIDPPEPQYRPFANREEAMVRFDDRVVRKKSGNISRISTVGKTSCRIGATLWDYDRAFDEFTFADGTPFGVRVDQ